MTTLIKLSDRMFIDVAKVSFVDLTKHLEIHGPAHIKAKVVLDGVTVVLNEIEATALMTALEKAGRL